MCSGALHLWCPWVNGAQFVARILHSWMPAAALTHPHPSMWRRSLMAPSSPCTHTHRHTPTHADTHRHTRRHTYTDTHTQTHTQTHTHTHACDYHCSNLTASAGFCQIFHRACLTPWSHSRVTENKHYIFHPTWWVYCSKVMTDLLYHVKDEPMSMFALYVIYCILDII